MNYWHVEHDVGWIPGRTEREDIYLSEEVYSYGPHWSREAFFDANYTSPTYGPLAPERMILSFGRRNAKKRVPTFVDSFSMLTCTIKDFLVFQPILGRDLVTHHFNIDGVPYITFRTLHRLNLLDLERSRYKEVLNGLPRRFSWVSLASAPNPHVDFFGLTWPKYLNKHAIVSDRFKQIYEAHDMCGLIFQQCYPAIELE